MLRTRLAAVVFVTALLASSLSAAQPFKAEPAASVDAATADAAPPVGPAWPRAPEPSATTTSSAPRPDPGPGLRERGGRTRRGNPASGVLLVLVIVGALGWYVVKRIRRF